MKIIVTGATSFIGREFTKLAVECGHNVYAVCRDLAKARKSLPVVDNLTFVECAMGDYVELPKKIPSADVFVHFAWAGTKLADRDLHDVHQDNVLYTIHSMKAAHQMGCQLFVDTGSQAEYGVVNHQITESTPCNPFSEYGKAKLEVYRRGQDFCKQLGLKYLHLRIFSVFGENDHPQTLIMTALRKMLSNEPLDLSSCTQMWNFLYVRDAVQQIYRLCENVFEDPSFVTDTFNIASEDTRVLRHFVEEMKGILKSDSTLSYGKFSPAHVITLDPNVSKVKNRIGFISNYSFEEAIRYIVDNMTRKSPDKMGG